MWIDGDRSIHRPSPTATSGVRRRPTRAVPGAAARDADALGDGRCRASRSRCARTARSVAHPPHHGRLGATKKCLGLPPGPRHRSSPPLKRTCRPRTGYSARLITRRSFVQVLRTGWLRRRSGCTARPASRRSCRRTFRRSPCRSAAAGVEAVAARVGRRIAVVLVVDDAVEPEGGEADDVEHRVVAVRLLRHEVEAVPDRDVDDLAQVQVAGDLQRDVAVARASPR